MQVRGDKIIVFSDNIFALKEYATRLKRPFIYGATSHAERTTVLSAFKSSGNVSSISFSIATVPSLVILLGLSHRESGPLCSAIELGLKSPALSRTALSYFSFRTAFIIVVSFLSF